MSTENRTKVIVPCRLSYAHLWEPDSVNGSEPKYSVSCIIDKKDKDTIAKIRKAVEIAKEEGKGKWGGKIPANLKMPLRDGDADRPEDEAYADSMFLNANSKQAPQIVDRQVQPILDQSDCICGYVKPHFDTIHSPLKCVKRLKKRLSADLIICGKHSFFMF